VTRNNLRLLLSPFFTEDELKQWFDPLSVEVDMVGKALLITFPHAFFAQWFTEGVRPVFDKKIAEVPHLASFSVQYRTRAGMQAGNVQASSFSQTKPLSPVNGARKNGENSLFATSEEGQNFIEQARIAKKSHSFDAFLSNRKNDFPLAAALQAASAIQGTPHSPFVIYGQSGCGKTHLLDAIINRVRETCADFPLFYGGPEHIPYLNENGVVPEQYRAFFLDDMQNVASSEDLQNRFMFFLDVASSRNAFVALCLESHPLGHNNFLQKIRTRLTSGLVVEMKKPDLDIRFRFIQKMIAEQGLPIGKEEAFALAQRYTDFRTIEGAIIKIKVYQSLFDDGNNNLSIILGAQDDQKTVTAQSILKNVAEFYHVPAEEITGKSRRRDVARARNSAVFLCRELLGVSLSQVGEFFGGRDHSSILYTIKKIQELKRSNTDTNNELTKLKKMCLSL